MYLDPTKTIPARNLLTQQPQFARATFNFNDPGIAGGIAFAALPQGAFITQVAAYVTTAFNAATTNVFTVGTTKANANEILASGAIAPGTLGYQNAATAAGLGLAATGAATAPQTLWAKYTQTGSAATAGQLTLIVSYILNNDE
jgi:hypothetical protein